MGKNSLERFRKNNSKIPKILPVINDNRIILKIEKAVLRKVSRCTKKKKDRISRKFREQLIENGLVDGDDSNKSSRFVWSVRKLCRDGAARSRTTDTFTRTSRGERILLSSPSSSWPLMAPLTSLLLQRFVHSLLFYAVAHGRAQPAVCVHFRARCSPGIFVSKNSRRNRWSKFIAK